MNKSESFFFAWEGASGPEGPWRHLLVLEARGTEAISAPYEYNIELALAQGASDVAHEDLLGAKATLWIRTQLDPVARLVHGIISEVEELAVEKGSRLRVKLSPPYVRAKMLRKSVVHVDQKLADILEETMTRTAMGMALEKSKDDRQEVTEESLDEYKPFKATFAVRCADTSRLDDASVRPYCVQYEESDVDFVARLLEEEGIAYHFEHTIRECVFVLSDGDTGRRNLKDQLSLAPEQLHRELRQLRAGGRLRPDAVCLNDYDFRKPDLDMMAASPACADKPAITMEQPGRYGTSSEVGKKLATFREEQLDSERRFATFETSCRALSAGTVFTLDHPSSKFSGVHLVPRIHVTLKQRESFGEHDGEPTYLARVEASRAGAPGETGGESKFRPARTTRRPRVAGSQTAVVTSEVGQEQEINVGGEEEFGCVRVRFHWDIDKARHGEEPTSCWVRVSQMFAGGKGHGAMFHPRVGDEVIVDFLEGDPDRPIITGRVYNGRNLSPENATNRPTYSCIKSMTSPYDGNYNMMAFDDLQGEEKFIVHVAKDYIANIRHNSTRFVANFDKVEVKGNQETLIRGTQDYTVKGEQKVTIEADHTMAITGQELHTVTGRRETRVGHEFLYVKADRQTTIGTNETTTITTNETHTVGANETHTVGSVRMTTIGSTDSLSVGGIMMRNVGGAIMDKAPTIVIDGNIVTIHGGSVIVKADFVSIAGGVVDVKGSSSINLNC